MTLNECVSCGGILTGRRRKYCSASCSKKEGRRAWVLKVYGITLEQYDAILDHQDGKCAICQRPPKPGKVLHIDHEHGGTVRGLLCGYCNTRLVGRLKDHTTAQALADYLRSPPAHLAQGVGLIIAPGRPKKKRVTRNRKGRTNG